MPATHQPTLFDTAPNPDAPEPRTPDVSGCQYVYRPKGRALEYSSLACNVYRGCAHGCVYCYAPSATQRSAEEFHRATTRPAYLLERVRKDAERYRAAGYTEPVLLCFTCDPYQPLDDDHRHARQVIQILHANGLPVQILTKGGLRAMRDLDLLGPGDAVAATLTFLDAEQSRLWEPHAAPPAERIELLREAHARGIETWASLEPVIDPHAAFQIIGYVAGFVDLFKVGKLNYPERLPDHLQAQVQGIDWRAFARDVVNVLKALGCRYYIKRSLRLWKTPTDFWESNP